MVSRSDGEKGVQFFWRHSQSARWSADIVDISIQGWDERRLRLPLLDEANALVPQWRWIGSGSLCVFCVLPFLPTILLPFFSAFSAFLSTVVYFHFVCKRSPSSSEAFLVSIAYEEYPEMDVCEWVASRYWLEGNAFRRDLWGGQGVLVIGLGLCGGEEKAHQARPLRKVDLEGERSYRLCPSVKSSIVGSGEQRDF